MRSENPGVKEIRMILLLGGAVFGASALALCGMPSLFLKLLDPAESDELIWSMRLMGVTLVTLSGNMMIVSYHAQVQAGAEKEEVEGGEDEEAGEEEEEDAAAVRRTVRAAAGSGPERRLIDPPPKPRWESSDSVSLFRLPMLG